MMRSLRCILLIATTSLVFGCTAQAPDSAVMIEAANALDQAFVQAFNNGDTEALAALYASGPDVVSFPPDMMEARGMDAIKQGTAQMFAAMPGARLEMTETHQIPGGDIVVGWGLWHMTMTGPDGNTIEMDGRYTDVKAERDGKWVYLLDHASVPLAPPPSSEQPAR